MAIRTGKFGYKYGWASGDNGWDEAFNDNLELLMLLASLTIEDRTLTAPPGSPSVGQCWIPAATATGLWTGHENDLAFWWLPPTASVPQWVFISMGTTTVGVVAHDANVDEMIVWNGTSWDAFYTPISLENLAIEDRTLTTPPGSPSVGQVWIPAATATGDWAGHEDDLAIWWQYSGDSAAWIFVSMGTTTAGTIVFDKSINEVIRWTGYEWEAILSVLSSLAPKTIAVENRTLTAPPGSPTVGQAWIPAATATGAWAGHEDDLAIWWQYPGGSPGWIFSVMTTDTTGMQTFDKGADQLILWNGTSWVVTCDYSP